MKYKLTKAEQETVINFDNKLDTASIYTCLLYTAQFFDDGSACSWCADAFSLYTSRKFIRAGTFHR